MNDQLKSLEERIETLSKNIEDCSFEIRLLKTELAKIKGEEFTGQAIQTSVAKQSLSGGAINFENLVGLKIIHFIGIIVLLIGLSIGVKYAIDANLISASLRIILAYIAGGLLFFISIQLRKKYLVFSLILFGGAMASAYFTSYAAFEYYSLFSRPVAFALMLFLTVFTVINSFKYNRQEIAILGLAGAYGIPFFVGDNNGSITGLFSYMLIINIGILVISSRKYWLPLTMVSFFTTWLIFIIVLLGRFRIENNDVFNLFSFVFFFLFLLNCLVFKFLKKQPVNSSDTFIVIADTLFLYLSVCVLHLTTHNDVSSITLYFAIAYAAGAFIAKKIQPLQAHFSNALLAASFIAFGVFVTTRYNGFTVTIIWVLMAVGIFITGTFYKIKILRMLAMFLFAATILKLLFVDSNGFSDIEKIIAYVFTGSVLLAVSFLYQKFKQRIFDDGGE